MYEPEDCLTNPDTMRFNIRMFSAIRVIVGEMYELEDYPTNPDILRFNIRMSVRGELRERYPPDYLITFRC